MDLGRHVGTLELDRLMLGDGLSECLPVPRVADGVLECGPRQADASGCSVEYSLDPRLPPLVN